MAGCPGDGFMDTAELLRLARENKGWSKSEAARQIGVTRATVGAWEDGIAFPNRSNAPRVAAAYNLPLASIAGDPQHANVAFLDNRRLTVRRVPLLDWVNAGQGAEVASSHVVDATHEFIETTFPATDRAFALEVRGDSMEPEFHQGDVIVVDPAVNPQMDDYIVAELLAKGEQTAPGSGEVTFKQYRPRGTGLTGSQSFDLLPRNPDYPTITVNKDHPGRIIGTVIEHRRRLGH